MTTGRRGGSAQQGRERRQQGHDAALRFALAIGMDRDYRRDPNAKKDVIDPAGDAHSVKAGAGKWQIFLYRRNRFIDDDGFQALNGVGSLLVHCIDAFPPRYEDYEGNETAAKERLRTPMRELKDRFQRKALLRAFLKKAFFNGGEVDYLTVLHGNRFHVYWNEDVVTAMADAFTVENSRAHGTGQFNEQKVIFKYAGNNVGEVEMRNESSQHYGEVRFNVLKPKFMELMENANLEEATCDFTDEIRLHGRAIRTFGKWPRRTRRRR